MTPQISFERLRRVFSKSLCKSRVETLFWGVDFLGLRFFETGEIENGEIVSIALRSRLSLSGHGFDDVALPLEEVGSVCETHRCLGRLSVRTLNGSKIGERTVVAANAQIQRIDSGGIYGGVPVRRLLKRLLRSTGCTT